MPAIDARYNAPLSEYRCGMLDCNSLLFKGKLMDAKIEIKCKCGTINKIEVFASRNGVGSYQDKLSASLVKK